jgi:tripartite-type tricarboxylate transporter receptor subunit TctC
MLKILSLACALLTAALPAAAQEYPKKQPIKIVVAANAGGVTDILARVTAEFLGRRMGQTVIVENKAGAASAIGADYVARSPADGYTLYMAGAELAVLPAVRNNLPYKFDEFTYLVRFWTTIPMMVVPPNAPYSTPQELIAYMKANPGKVRWGAPGVGSLNHVGTAMFESSVGVKGEMIPYTGIAPIYTDLVAGNVDMAMGAVPPFPEALKVLGPSGTRRHVLYPNLPTLAELGYKDASHDAWFGLLAPPNVPKPIADRLIAEINAVLKDPEAIAKYKNVAKDVPDASPLVGADFKKRVLEENARWKVIAAREKISIN